MTAVIIIAACLYIGGLHIEFDPFKVSLPYWRTSLALVLFVSALLLCSNESYRKGYKDGIKNFKEVLNREVSNRDKL